MRCPKAAPFPTGITDEVENRSDDVVKAPNLLCTPAQIFFGAN